MSETRSNTADAPAALYRGLVTHARLVPFSHRFRYRVMSLLIDIDRLDEAGRMSALFSVGRFNLFSFHPADHGARDGSALRPHVEGLLRGAGIHANPARIRLLAYPRILGFVFNPLSVYFCDDAAGRPMAIVYEVRNTFGEMHPYVLPVSAGDGERGIVVQRQKKRFYVSPFLDMDLAYRFRISPPDEGVRLHILESDSREPVFVATFSGARQALTSGALLSTFAAMPLMTFKIVAAIHWQALRLWLKGARYHPHAARIRPVPKGLAGEQIPAENVSMSMGSMRGGR